MTGTHQSHQWKLRHGKRLGRLSARKSASLVVFLRRDWCTPASAWVCWLHSEDRNTVITYKTICLTAALFGGWQYTHEAFINQQTLSALTEKKNGQPSFSDTGGSVSAKTWQDSRPATLSRVSNTMVENPKRQRPEWQVPLVQVFQQHDISLTTQH